MLNTENTTNYSLSQSIYNLIENILNEYSVLQPEFKYKLYFGTNIDSEEIVDNDVFSIVLYLGSVEKLPTYYEEINGVYQLLYAGYIDVALSIINPISLEYTEEARIHILNEINLNDNFSIQDNSNMNNFEGENILSTNDMTKIEVGTRLLEGLSVFMTRKNVNVDNFKFSIRADNPLITGQFDIGRYRLTENLAFMCKFALQNDLGKSLFDGEELKVWLDIPVLENGSLVHKGNWTKLYSVLEMSVDSSAVTKDYPIAGSTTIKSIANQMTRICTISAPELDLGASKDLKELVLNGELDKLQDIKVKYYDGKKYRQFNAVVMIDTRPISIDKFSSLSISLNITTDIIEVGD